MADRRLRLVRVLVIVAVPAFAFAALVLRDAWRWKHPLVLARGDSAEGLAVFRDGKTVLVNDRHRGPSLVRPTLLGLETHRIALPPVEEPEGWNGGVYYPIPLALSPDERLAFLGVRDYVGHLVALDGGGVAAPIDTKAYLAAFSPDGRSLVTVAEIGSATLWDVPSGRASRTLDSATQAAAVAFSRDGATVLTTNWYGSVVITSAETGRASVRHEFEGSPGFAGAWFLRQKNAILTQELGMLRVLDTTTWASVREIPADDGIFDRAALSPDEGVVAVARSFWGREPPRMDFFRLDSGARLSSVVLGAVFSEIAVKDNVVAIAWTPSGDACVVGMRSGVVLRFPVPPLE